jgi:DNA-nicking Smr family endonuclease
MHRWICDKAENMNMDDEFRDAMADVAPLKSKRLRIDATGKPSPAQLERRDARLERRDAAEGKTKKSADENYLTLGEVTQRDPREILQWKKDGVQRQVFRRLKQGGYPVEEQLDLHGHTVREARVQLLDYLTRARARARRVVLIAHGRGEKSATPARIKSYVAHWLEQIPEVIAFHSAMPHQGGTGAVYVLLQKSRESKEANREAHGKQGGDTEAL